MSHRNRLTKKGFSLVEILTSLALFIIYVFVVLDITVGGVRQVKQSGYTEMATALAEEGVEVSRSLRDAGANFSLLPDGIYGLSSSGGQWSLLGDSDTQDIFTRTVVVSTINANQKKVEVTVSWTAPSWPSNSVTTTTYLTNWRSPLIANGTLTVNKIVINHGGTKVATDFAPFNVGATTVQLGIATSFAPGVYIVTETTDPGYTRTFSGDCDAVGSVTVASNSDKTCTITNEETTNGLLVYGDGTTEPKYRLYREPSNIFAAQEVAPTSAAGRTFNVRTSPTKREAIAGYVTATGTLQVMCYNGSTWTNEWTAVVGGTGATRPFDISYETSSGDAIILYSANVGTTNELAYRTKLGSNTCGSANWSGSASFDPVRTSGVIQWVKMAWDRRVSSSLITAIWADSNSDLSAAVWTGAEWGNEPTSASETSLQVLSTAQDLEDFDVEYESLSGDVMIIWGNSAGNTTVNGVRYRTCTGGTATCIWNAVETNPPTWANSAATLDISANPATDEIVFASIGSPGFDLQAGYWNGSSWTNTNDLDTSCSMPAAGSKLVATGWLTSGGATRSFITYGDQGSNNIDWVTGNSGVFTKETDVEVTPDPNPTNPWIDIQVNPRNPAELMYLIADSANSLFAKRLVMSSAPAFTWTNSDGEALSTTLPQNINSPFSFSFWRR